MTLDYGEQSRGKRNLRNTGTVIVTEFKLALLTQDRPINQEMVLGQERANLFGKVSRLRRWWTSIPKKNHLAWIWVLISFPEQR